MFQSEIITFFLNVLIVANALIKMYLIYESKNVLFYSPWQTYLKCKYWKCVFEFR